jgi:hypothetical protein
MTYSATHSSHDSGSKLPAAVHMGEVMSADLTRILQCPAELR